MKSFYLLALLISTGLSATSQIRAGVSYSFSLPQQEMRDNIKPLNALNLHFLSHFKKIPRLAWGIDVGFGQYAFFTKEQHVHLPDGSGFDADVSYSSNTIFAGLVTRYQFLKEAKVNPYINGRLGYANFFSTVIVGDPNDDTDCKPLDKKTPISDHSFYASYGGGVQIDVSSRRKPKSAWIDISIGQVHGTRLDYINVKDIQNGGAEPSAPVSGSAKTAPLNVKFVNVTTQTIHEHQLAEVYNSSLRMLEMKVGVIWRFTDSNCQKRKCGKGG